jgi:hypothetical protein
LAKIKETNLPVEEEEPLPPQNDVRIQLENNQIKLLSELAKVMFPQLVLNSVNEVPK